MRALRKCAAAPVWRREIWDSTGPWELECGATLPTLRLAYETWGEPSADGSGAVLVIHALTGDTHATGARGGGPGWWDGFVGPGRLVDPARHFVVCANLPGSCYGSSGPATVDPWAKRPPGPDFPAVTTRDMARALRALLDSLGVGRVELVVGGSLGAMVAWEFAVEFPEDAARIAPLSGPPRATAWQVAFNHLGREAIESDPEWRGGRYSGAGPRRGMALARAAAMVSYRTAELYEGRFGRDRVRSSEGDALEAENLFQVERYLAHQGKKLADRFDANSYLALTRAMDTHDVGRGRGGFGEALGRIRAEVLVAGTASDVLYPPACLREPVCFLRALGRPACYIEVPSVFGHDAFLAEPEKFAAVLAPPLGWSWP